MLIKTQNKYSRYSVTDKTTKKRYTFEKGEQISAHSSFTSHNVTQSPQQQLGYWLLEQEKPYENKPSHALKALNTLYQSPCYQNFSAGMPQLSLNQLKKTIYESIKQKRKINCLYLWVYQIHSPMLKTPLMPISICLKMHSGCNSESCVHGGCNTVIPKSLFGMLNTSRQFGWLREIV